MTKAQLVELLERTGNGYILNYYEVKTFEQVAEEQGVDVADLKEGAEDGWESYGGAIVGCLEAKEDLPEWLAEELGNRGEDLGSIWANGFCGVNYGSEGRPRWADGLCFVNNLEDADKAGYAWDEGIEEFIPKSYVGKLEWDENKDGWVDRETGEVAEWEEWA